MNDVPPEHDPNPADGQPPDAAAAAQVCPINLAVRWPPGLTIRTTTLADAQGLCALHNLPLYRSGTLRTPYHSVAELEQRIASRAANVTSLVAVMDGQIVGDIGLTRHVGRRQHSGSFGMGVHDAYQRRGIGRALLGEIVAIADRWLNIERLEMTVYADNAAAIGLYESFGFAREGLMRRFAFRDGAYADALAMARLRP